MVCIEESMMGVVVVLLVDIDTPINEDYVHHVHHGVDSMRGAVRSSGVEECVRLCI